MASNLTLAEALKRASLFLGPDSSVDQARHFWMLVFDQTLTDIVLELNDPVDQEKLEKFKKALEAVKENIPIQYHLGHADFRDKRYKVTPATLIPREETSGLVDLALENVSSGRVLDIGTGSGIIAISLALENPDYEVTAVDISSEALEVARLNAHNLGAEVNFIQSDLFSGLSEREGFDLIISNPPYIAADELELMDISVKKHEPETALYAGVDGLDIYRRISEEVTSYLNPAGIILFEIGFRQGQAVSDIFKEIYPDAKIAVYKDFMDLDRYVMVDTRGE